MAALWAHGYRTSTSQPGHHETALQSLTLTIGLDAKTLVLLDTLRRQRNVSDYDGSPFSPTSVEECQRQAKDLLKHVKAWLASHRPDLA